MEAEQKRGFSNHKEGATLGEIITQESREQRKDRSIPLSLGMVLFVFLLIPSAMYFFGADLVSIFAVMIFFAGLIADVFTTKAGFNRGYGEYNIFYNIAIRGRQRIRNNSFLIGGFAFGVIRAGIMYYFWNDSFILLLVASLSLVGPLWNSIMLSYPDDDHTKSPVTREIPVFQISKKDNMKT